VNRLANARMKRATIKLTEKVYSKNVLIRIPALILTLSFVVKGR